MKLRIYSLMTALFILGMICGILISFGIAKQQIRSITSRTTPEVTSLVVRFLDHRLDLTREQKIAVGEVLKKGEADVLPLRREFRERALTMIKTYQPKVAVHLEDSQKKKLDQIVTNLLNTWQLNEDPDASN